MDHDAIQSGCPTTVFDRIRDKEGTEPLVHLPVALYRLVRSGSWRGLLESVRLSNLCFFQAPQPSPVWKGHGLVFLNLGKPTQMQTAWLEEGQFPRRFGPKNRLAQRIKPPPRCGC